MGQADGKYWIANNPNSEVNDTKAQKIAELSATTVTLAELNALDADSTQCTITPASSPNADGATVEFAIQFKDAAGVAIDHVIGFTYYVSPDAAGVAMDTAVTTIADGKNIGTNQIVVTDASGSDGYFVNSPAGEYGILYADNATHAGRLLQPDATKKIPCGLLYYQAGIAVTNAAGLCELDLTEAGADTVYLAIIMPDGRVAVSSACVWNS